MRNGKPKGVFRLGALESTAGSRLAPLLSRYHSAYPEVVVELATGTTGAVVTRVMNFELEAAFVSEPFTAPGLQARPVFEERLVLVTSKAIAKLSGPAGLGRSTLITVFVGREKLVISDDTPLMKWCKELFLLLFRLSLSAVEFFRMPSCRVVELGGQTEF
jgi:DNA-binding transcriptional LysR family regulator